MFLKAGGAFVAHFTTADPATGAAANADSTPTATAYVNGTANAWSLTVASVATGLYKVTGTVPALSAGDAVDVVVSATVDAVAGKARVASFQVLSAGVHAWLFGAAAPLAGADEVEDGVTVMQALSAIAAVLAGKYVVDATGTTATFYAVGDPTTERVEAAVGPLGRSSVTLTLP